MQHRNAIVFTIWASAKIDLFRHEMIAALNVQEQNVFRNMGVPDISIISSENGIVRRKDSIQQYKKRSHNRKKPQEKKGAKESPKEPKWAHRIQSEHIEAKVST